MPEPSVALSILSLVTTPEKAAEIEGDLLELHLRRTVRFWFDILRTACSLFAAAVAGNLFVIALLSYAAYELSAKAFFWVIRPFRWYLEFELGLPGQPTIALTYALVVMFTFLIGGCLVRLFPAIGAQVAVGAISLFFLRLVVLQEPYTFAQLVVCVAVPMLVGSALTNWWGLRGAAQ